MTDTGPPTELGEVVVTGQRRRPDGTFPSAGPSGGGGVGDPGGVNQNELPPDQPQPEPEPNPCAHPDSALAWNADAAAAEAAAALFAKAASLNDGSTLGNREFALNLVRGLGSHVSPQPNVSVGPVPLPGQVPSVDLDMTGTNPGNWMGDIHNHPSGDGRLSDGEWNYFINYLSSISATNPERRSELGHVSAYVVVLDATSSKGYRIYAYNRDTPYDVLGAEVNPDAQPCPGM